MGNNRKKRTAATAGAVGLVVALILTGTYAWQSISQSARNENIVYANPGGRLHDDWDGENKMVYVENFTGSVYDEKGDLTADKDTDATSIYVRVKLQEYMEFGDDAGVKTVAEGTTKSAKPLITGADINDTDTWSTYIKGQSSPFDNYLTLTDGKGLTTDYLPTFNKNKMSIIADINGTYEGVTTTNPDGSTTVEHFGDYTPWKKGDADYGESSGTAYYYSEAEDAIAANTAKDAPAGSEKTHETAEETHEVTTSLATADVITMKEWLAITDESKKTGKFWVCDTDGWAYWAEELEPGTATGPLLSKVELTKKFGSNCYYAINVIGEFASAGDWGDKDAEKEEEQGFYATGLTDNALSLLNKISKSLSADYVDITATSVTYSGATGPEGSSTTNSISVEPGATVTFSGEVTLLGKTITNQEIKWSIPEEDTQSLATESESETEELKIVPKDGKAVLTIPKTTTPQTIEVTATPEANPSAAVTYKVKVKSPTSVTVLNSSGKDFSSVTTKAVAKVNRTSAGANEETITLKASVAGASEAYTNQAVDWAVVEGNEDEDTKVVDGVLTVGEEVSGTILTIRASSQVDEEVYDEVQVRVTDSPLDLATLETVDKVSVDKNGVLLASVKQSDGTYSENTEVITIGTDEEGDTAVSFYVLAKKDGKALLLSDGLPERRRFYDTTIGVAQSSEYNRWKFSTLRYYLNGTGASYLNSEEAGWLYDKSTLRSAAISTTINAIQEVDTSGTIVGTTDQIFLLSEPDVYDTCATMSEIPAKLYTVTSGANDDEKGVKLVAPNGSWKLNMEQTDGVYWWLRSPRGNANGVCVVKYNGVKNTSDYSFLHHVCPALWIEL